LMRTETKKHIVPRLYFIITAILSAAAVSVQTYLFFAYYEENLNLYKAGAQLPGIFYICIFISALFCTSSSFIFRKDSSAHSLPPAGRFVSFAAILSGFLLLASVLLNSWYYLSGVYTAVTPLRAAAYIAAVPASFYFIITAMSRAPKQNVIVLLGITAIIWAALYLMCIYFDMTSPLNSPIRILNQLSLITIMLYLTFEVRYLLGAPRLNLYFPVALLAMLFISMSSVSDIILTFSSVRASSQETVFRVTEAAIMLYIAARAGSVASDTREQEPQTTATQE
jgi:hypothetical protein